MRKLTAVFVTGMTALTLTAAAAGETSMGTEKEARLWLTDFEKARERADNRDVPILVNFAGSDWCGWCIRLEKEAFSKQAFKAYAKDNLVLMLADFPRNKQQAPEVKKQNQRLARKYQIRGFPTVLLLNPNGRVIARTGYKAGGAEAYVEHLKSLVP